MSHNWQGKAIDKYNHGVVKDPNPAARRGYALALGALPADLLQRHTGDVLKALIHAATTIQDNPDERDAESRKNAVLGMIEACEAMGVEACYSEASAGMSKQQVRQCKHIEAAR
jgi:hypothetical protein